MGQINQRPFQVLGAVSRWAPNATAKGSHTVVWGPRTAGCAASGKMKCVFRHFRIHYIHTTFISRFRRSKLVFDVVSLWPCCAWGCMGSGQPFHFMVSKYPILSDPCWWNWAWDVYAELGQVWGKAAVCCQQCFSCLLSHVSLSVIDIEQCYFRRLSYTPEIHDGSPRKSHKQYIHPIPSKDWKSSFTPDVCAPCPQCFEWLKHDQSDAALQRLGVGQQGGFMDTRSIARYSQDARPRCISTAYNYTLRYITLHYNAIYKCKRKRKCKYHTYKHDYIYILYMCVFMCLFVFFLCVCVIMYPHHCTSIHLMCGFQESGRVDINCPRIFLIVAATQLLLPWLFCLFFNVRVWAGFKKLRPAVITTHVLFIFSLHHPMIGHLILTHTHLFSMFGWSCRWKAKFSDEGRTGFTGRILTAMYSSFPCVHAVHEPFWTEHHG